MKFTDVLIKWTGSKRLQSDFIIDFYPKKIKTYYEPFIGGGSMLFALLNSDIELEKIECSDLNKPLIEIWKLTRDNPKKLSDAYFKYWNELKIKGGDFYYETRQNFNSDQDPLKFFFLLRTCRNGLIRYNKKGQFTSAFHHGRSGMNPEKLEETIYNWHSLMSQKDIEFIVRDYADVVTKEGDFIYLDPPYKVSSSRTVMYFGEIDLDRLWEWMRIQKAHYIMSLNGTKDGVDMCVDVPEDLYTLHEFVNTGWGKFSQLQGNKVEVKDSLYVR